jgi:hypothetical protein
LARLRSILWLATCFALGVISLAAAVWCVRSFFATDTFVDRFATPLTAETVMAPVPEQEKYLGRFFMREKSVTLARGGIRVVHRRNRWGWPQGAWFESTDGWEREAYPSPYPYFAPLYPVPYERWGGLGFEFARVGGPATARHPAQENSYSVCLPLPVIVLLTAVPPLLWTRRWVRERRRRKSGHCPVCGYDLRATPDRCPECGLAVGSFAERAI